MCVCVCVSECVWWGVDCLTLYDHLSEPWRSRERTKGVIALRGRYSKRSHTMQTSLVQQSMQLRNVQTASKRKLNRIERQGR